MREIPSEYHVASDRALSWGRRAEQTVLRSEDPELEVDMGVMWALIAQALKPEK